MAAIGRLQSTLVAATLKKKVETLIRMAPAAGVAVSVGVALLGLLLAAARRFNSWVYEPKLAPGKKMPPGDLGWPALGVIREFVRYFKSGNPDGWVANMVKKWGKLGLYKTHIFGKPMVLATSAETCKLVLTNDELFFTCWPESTQRLMGANSFACIGADAHKRLRSLTIRTINGFDVLSSYIPRIEKIALNTLDGWASRDRITFLDELRSFTFDIIASIFVGYDPSPQTTTLFKSFIDLNSAMRAMPINLPGTAYHKALKSRARVVRLIQAEVDKRRAQKPGQRKSEDVLQTMMEWKDDSGRSLTDPELVDILLMYLNSGHESSAHTTMWLLINMHRNPEVLRKIKEEQQAIRDAKKPGEGITLADFRKMKYLSVCIDETLRIANISQSVFRKALQPVEYNGLTIPKGWMVKVFLRNIHMDRELYPNPTKFDPDRWTNYIPRPGQFVPFGLGSRLCPGQELARLEISVFIHYMILKYEMQPLNLYGEEEYLPYHKPKDNCPVVITKREGVTW